MGTSAAETVKEIEDTRDRLETQIRELEGRMPSPAVWTKRLIGVAVGGGVSGTLFWIGVRRIRSRRAANVQQQQVAVPTVVQLVPEGLGSRISEAFENGEIRTWAVGIGAAWIVLRLAELRQLRRMNRALVAAR
jgi:hypothetical protein